VDAFEEMDPLTALKRFERIAVHISHFKPGICVRRTDVCVVGTGPLSSTIKIFKTIDQNVCERNKTPFRKLLQAGKKRHYNEFHVPVHSNSIHFLRTKLCGACVNRFGIIDSNSLYRQVCSNL